MADVSKIQLPDEGTYNIKDATARELINSLCWANILTSSTANYITEPEVKSIKINGSSTNAASSSNAVLQYNSTDKCIEFIFN